jgi:hypothetical protein
MDPVDSDPGSDPKKRRTKLDPSERVFRCGCGKTYLSYPALYTHVKQKHDGTPPEGSTSTGAKPAKPRGRPKQIRAERTPDEEAFYVQHDFLGGPADPMTGCPKELLESMEKDNSDSLGPESPCREVFAEYFKDVALKVKQDSLQVFSDFLEALLVCLDAKGWTLPGEPPAAEESFTSVRSAQRVPDIANFFVTDFLEGRKGDLTRPMAVELMLHLCRWLYAQRFTAFKLALLPST